MDVPTFVFDLLGRSLVVCLILLGISLTGLVMIRLIMGAAGMPLPEEQQAGIKSITKKLIEPVSKKMFRLILVLLTLTWGIAPLLQTVQIILLCLFSGLFLVNFFLRMPMPDYFATASVAALVVLFSLQSLAFAAAATYAGIWLGFAAFYAVRAALQADWPQPKRFENFRPGQLAYATRVVVRRNGPVDWRPCFSLAFPGQVFENAIRTRDIADREVIEEIAAALVNDPIPVEPATRFSLRFLLADGNQCDIWLGAGGWHVTGRMEESRRVENGQELIERLERLMNPGRDKPMR